MVVSTSSPLVGGPIISPLQSQCFHWVQLFTDPMVPSSLHFLSIQPAGSPLPGSALSPFDFTTSFLPESIVPAFSRRLTPKQSLPPAVTTLPPSFEFTSELPHRCHTVPKESTILCMFFSPVALHPLYTLWPPVELKPCYLLPLHPNPS